MITDTGKKIVEFVAKNGRGRPAELVRELGITQSAVQRQLKKLTSRNDLVRVGKPPRVYYLIPGTGGELVDQKIVETIGKTLKNKGIVFAGLFGSYAKKTARSDSDIDLMVEFQRGKKYSLFDLGGIKMDLEDKLKKKVDLVTPRSISPILRKEIMDTMEPIYDNR